jgi:hypothetical protein
MLDISDILDRITALYEARGEYELDSKAAWIALVAHYLELREIHKKSEMKWAKKKPKGIIKDPVTIADPETGQVQLRPVKGKRKKETAVQELDPGDFARWRGIDPILFDKMVDRYQKRAERFLKTKEHKNIMRKVLRADPQLRRLRYERKKGRKRNPADTLKQVMITAKYLTAKQRSPWIKQKDWAARNNVSDSNLSRLLRTYRSEAEAYMALKKGGHEIGEPEPEQVSSKEKDAYHKEREDSVKGLLPQLASQISKARRERGTSLKATVAAFAKEHNVDADLLEKTWLKLKNTPAVRTAVAKEMGLTPPVRKRRGPKPKPKPDKPRLIRGGGSYRGKRKGEKVDDAWMELAIAVEKEGQITDAMALHYADLVGVRVIKAVRSFPAKWGDSQIAKWMEDKRASYVTEAKPKLEAKLREMGIWNPQKSTITKLPVPRIGEPAKLLPDPTQKRAVLIVGGVKSRVLAAHQWLSNEFDVTFISAGRTAGKAGTAQISKIRSAASSGKADLIIVMSAFIGHYESDAVISSAPKDSIVIERYSGGKRIRSIGHAAMALKNQKLAPWFVDAYEKEKGTIQDSLDQIIYNLLQGTSLETVFSA